MQVFTFSHSASLAHVIAPMVDKRAKRSVVDAGDRLLSMVDREAVMDVKAVHKSS